MVFRIVIDTNVLVGALLQQTGTNRRVIRACLEGKLSPLVGQTLFLEYEDVLGRASLFQRSPLSAGERWELLAALLAVSEWVQVYYSWRPNLPDEADNHLVELAVAGGATMIVTNNIRDFQRAELRFPAIRILSPSELLKELP
ncbi:MAG: putative toxin-antitoxin system toxin component, PIN family [Acidobacteriia bacterium]|nr:putative toxin-antitoxin system toxin component, PIN family [Terriglobia bacterium]